MWRRYIVATQFQYFKNAFRRFFGFGNSAPESHETNYTSEEAIVHLTAGININADLAVMWSEHFRSVSVLQGAVESLPQTRGFFPDVNGLEGAEVLGHRVTLRYDTRDKQLIPTRGTYFTAAVEYDHNFRHENSGWFRTTFDGRRYFAHHLPYVEAPAVFVAHFFADATNGGNIPFYERPTLGGENTLRAFGQGRFVSDTAILFNFEERIPIREQKIFDHLLDIELAPFLDLGRVMGRFKASNFQNLQYNPGLGFRVVAKPHVVGRLDVAYGKDGGNLYVGIDYPF
jgi:outer membrane protein assembly factor BamA